MSVESQMSAKAGCTSGLQDLPSFSLEMWWMWALHQWQD